MNDEYGEIDSTGETYCCNEFVLESGLVLVHAQVRYNVYGNLNTDKNNVLIVCHALTGNSRLDQWWASMLGPGRPFDTSKFLVVCANALGSCYGSTGPMSVNEVTGSLYGIGFPEVTIRDTVRLHMQMVKEAIGAHSVACVVGGSMGGMQALEWGIEGGAFVKSLVVIACNSAHTAWQIAMSEAQRQAIFLDPKWRGGLVDPLDPPIGGLSVARQIGMVSYRTAHGYATKFGRTRHEPTGAFEVQRYLAYQGRKISERFDAITYVKLTEQLDTHDVGRGRGSVEIALQSIRARVLVVGIESDLLYPLYEQTFIADNIPGSLFRVIHSPEGHDAFILEQEEIGRLICEFLTDPILDNTDPVSALL